jgi:maltose O-acetyltransferase
MKYHYLPYELNAWMTYLVSKIPGRIGMAIRYIYYKRKCPSLGERVRIFEDVLLMNAENIHIGRSTFINRRTLVHGKGGIAIGENVLIGPGVFITSVNHGYRRRDKIIQEQGFESQKITIQDDVWIGAQSVVLPGVTIMKGAVVAAGAVVTKDVDEYTVVGGNPAGLIATRK